MGRTVTKTVTSTIREEIVDLQSLNDDYTFLMTATYWYDGRENGGTEIKMSLRRLKKRVTQATTKGQILDAALAYRREVGNMHDTCVRERIHSFCYDLMKFVVNERFADYIYY